MARPKVRLAILLLVNALGTCALLGTAELVARVLLPREADGLFSDRLVRVRDRPFVRADEELGFVLTPGYRQSDPEIRINSQGLRGDALPGDLTGRYRILALGDSTTFGWEVDQGDDYPSQLQGWLDRHRTSGSPYVMNAGVPSYTSKQVLLSAQRLIRKLQPQILIVSSLWNDLIYSSLPSWYPEVLVMQQPPLLQRVLLSYSGLYRAIALPKSRGDAIDVENPRAREQYRENMRRIAALCDESDTTLLFLLPPFDIGHVREHGIAMPSLGTRFSREFFLTRTGQYVETLGLIADELGVDIIPHRISVRSPSSADLFQDFIHPNALGNRILAEDVGMFLLREIRALAEIS